MSRVNLPHALLLIILFFGSLVPTALAAGISIFQSSLEKRYSTAHSLGDNYQFDPRDGWQTINITNLQYKYSRAPAENGSRSISEDISHIPAGHGKRSSKKTSSKKATTKTGSKPAVKSLNNGTNTVSDATNGILGSVKSAIDSIKAIGSAQPVTITWYTGKDLLNPSCWSNTQWAPTDDSFACALTEEGWVDRPKCFKFLELCNTSKKCVFVRVVDTCAGCAAGSKHVDLTKAAFSSLADLNEGVLTVQMRQATEPSEGWLEELWGPKTN
ncbi:uncharacterized protein LAESUDRAFT_753837 [Laetiporus sulphureus 93-53]|uniref:RlpA-like protein double-psi beta-barrel domain-containing protein n=1 Tax=Laetiporus sulphureus 93-53 TaxID=1314785 RepID=A0A165IA96_9APHY|nr:uncharacterized protein LAESUDRAFT_753837 [Laetiporus sulphureus 93-53]KZT12799.1 hypothetical protein LAESUDRAFT_753837 [Laetiporus sulphureus 93-53]